MPGLIEPETIAADDLPTLWSPIQEPLDDEEHARELEEQATASLLWAAPVAEQILRVLLNEAEVEAVTEPPPGYDPDVQGEWDPDVLTFAFKRPIRRTREDRSSERLVLEYRLEGAGDWLLEITPEGMTLGRI